MLLKKAELIKDSNGKTNRNCQYCFSFAFPRGQHRFFGKKANGLVLIQLGPFSMKIQLSLIDIIYL